MGGDGHNLGHPVLSVAFRFGSICGYVDDEDVGDGVFARPSSMSTQGMVNEERGII